MLVCIAIPQYRLVPEAAHAAWEDFLDELDAMSPLVDDRGPGLVYLDMRGIAGDPAGWMAHASELAQHLPDPRIGCASNAFVAFAASGVAGGRVCPAGDEARFVAPLPLSLLEIDPKTIERLRLLGVAKLGDLAKLPYGPFVRRFGIESARWHEHARGIDRTPLRPRARGVAIEASIFGEGRIEDETQVFFALRALLARLCDDLERSGKRCGALQLEIELEDAGRAQIDVPLATPTADERGIFDVLRATLEGRTFQAAIVGLRLQAARLEEGGERLTLFAEDDVDAQAVGLALARLEASLGEPARRARIVPAHPLEERFGYDRFSAPARAHGAKAEAPAFSALSAQAVPQLRLLHVREIQVSVRAGQPAAIGTPARNVLECIGPWRIEEGWFGAQVARDEYDVLLEDGGLYRIFRQGERWYVRGAYD
jgi:protein ImuB